MKPTPEPCAQHTFPRVAAAILGTLHEAFPAPLDIHAPSLAESLASRCPLPTDTAHTVGHALEWLVAEGYIRCALCSPPLYGRCVLTARGYSALQHPVQLPGGAPTPGQTLGYWLQHSAVTAATAAIHHAIARLFAP